MINYLKYIFPTVIAFFYLSGCKDGNDEPENNNGTGSQGELIYIDPTVTYQEMEGFGASDCWRVQFVGENWPLEKREAIADLLFSQETDEEGNPKGIGLSLWRFNIGAGSAEQGNESNIDNSWRRAECFLNEDGTYDWTKQSGQQWFLNAAKERGVESFLAFVNSPPVYFTKNGKAYSPGGNNINLASGRMSDFSEFLAAVCEHFEDEGMGFDFLSPVNEPQWDWESSGQEGSPATNQDIATLVRTLSTDLQGRNLQTQVVVPEAGELQYLYQANGKEERGNQIDAFFNPSSSYYIGDLLNVKDVVLGHSYWTTANLTTLVDVRNNLGSKLGGYGFSPGFWQSEFCILEYSDDIGGGWSRDLSIATALYVARVIHFDITLAYASSWSWWTALSQYDYKDGLIYLDNGNGGINGPSHPDSEALKSDGYYRESKLLWALGNYSRFVRPGMVRVKSGFSIPKSEEYMATNVMFSAFKDTEENKLVLVFVNYSDSDKRLTIGSLGDSFSIVGNTFDSYTTSASDDLEKGEMPADEIVIGGRSVVTLVGEMK
ncbi:glycoside hydrolase [Thermophagus sp. OGC60D27]|uniref:glycoside hydrolase n=1 Tax=Thermophagus sp. OGC60D27 TaxID=3458415 RepID=UPI0040380156